MRFTSLHKCIYLYTPPSGTTHIQPEKGKSSSGSLSTVTHDLFLGHLEEMPSDDRPNYSRWQEAPGPKLLHGTNQPCPELQGNTCRLSTARPLGMSCSKHVTARGSFRVVVKNKHTFNKKHTASSFLGMSCFPSSTRTLFSQTMGILSII